MAGPGRSHQPSNHAAPASVLQDLLKHREHKPKHTEYKVNVSVLVTGAINLLRKVITLQSVSQNNSPPGMKAERLPPPCSGPERFLPAPSCALLRPHSAPGSPPPWRTGKGATEGSRALWPLPSGGSQGSTTQPGRTLYRAPQQLQALPNLLPPAACSSGSPTAATAQPGQAASRGAPGQGSATCLGGQGDVKGHPQAPLPLLLLLFTPSLWQQGSGGHALAQTQRRHKNRTHREATEQD